MRSRRRTRHVTEDDIFWYFTIAYILHTVGLLDNSTDEWIEQNRDDLNFDWRCRVKQELGIEDKFVKSVFALYTEYKPRHLAVLFLLRGFGCPNPVERMMEFSKLSRS